jgi:hypothetical protein
VLRNAEYKFLKIIGLVFFCEYLPSKPGLRG